MLLKQLAEYLAAQGWGTFDPTGPDSTIFVGVLPLAQPNACITLLEHPGNKPRVTLSIDEPRVQLIIRGAEGTREETRAQAHDLLKALHGYRNAPFVADGIWVCKCLSLQSAPADLGVDINRRPEFSINFDLQTMRDRST